MNSPAAATTTTRETRWRARANLITEEAPMAAVRTICRCSVELIVKHGGVISCTHCDSPCSGRKDCGFCALLAVTCCDCRTVHADSVGRSKCESLHR